MSEHAHKIEVHELLGATPERVWEFLHNFHQVSKWLPDVNVEKEKKHDGKKRRRITYGHHHATLEQLDELDEEKHVLKYSSVKGHNHLLHTEHYDGVMHIEPMGRTRTKLTWTIHYTMKHGEDHEEAKKFFHHLASEGLSGIKVAAEG